MVAVVSLARHFCLASHVGIAVTRRKIIIRQSQRRRPGGCCRTACFRVSTSRIFEAQAHAYCHELKQTPPGSAT